jgi:hypothetical protein
MQQQGGEAFDSIIANIIGSLGDGACLTTSTSSSASCSPLALPFDDDYWEEKGRRLEGDGCQQCSGTDDDDDDASYSHADDDNAVGQTRRRLGGVDAVVADESGHQSALLTYTITAGVPDGEDPLIVMNGVEGLIVEFFADKENARNAWISKANSLGASIPEDTHIFFTEPEVENDSIHISRPGDFIDHHYNSNSNVRVGTWVGASLAGLALVLSAKYGVKAYRLQHDAAELEKEKASEWANIEEAEGDVTLNPLAGGDGAVRHRSNSGGVA